MHTTASPRRRSSGPPLGGDRALILVLHHAADPVAAATAALARRLTSERVETVSVEELTLAASWSHTQSDGRIHTLVELPDGRRIDSDTVGAVLNRARYTPAPPFPRARDREYALMEMFALLVSWLHGLSCPVANPASARGLAGSERSLFEWLRLAASCDLPTRRVRFTTDGRRFHLAGMQAHQPPLVNACSLGPALNGAVPAGPRPVLFAEQVGAIERVLVIDETVFGGPKEAADRLRRFAAASESVILEVGMASSNDQRESVVCSADPFPQQLTDEEVESLAAWLVTAASRRGRR